MLGWSSPARVRPPVGRISGLSPKKKKSSHCAHEPSDCIGDGAPLATPALMTCFDLLGLSGHVPEFGGFLDRVVGLVFFYLLSHVEGKAND